MIDKGNYRDVTLADQAAKVFGSQIRDHAYPQLQEKALPGMYGSGLNGWVFNFTFVIMPRNIAAPHRAFHSTVDSLFVFGLDK